MEDVLDVYALPYDPKFPVVCMDESCKQLLGEVRPPLPRQPGIPERKDDEYVRMGAAQIFLAVEPLTRKTIIHIGQTRARRDWAHFMRTVIDAYPEATKVRLVMDNLNTHGTASFYDTFLPEEAHRLASKLEIHYTPKHGSWLNIAEIELSSYKRGCLRERMPTHECVRSATEAWLSSRKAGKIQWQFRSEDARIKLRSLYPTYS